MGTARQLMVAAAVSAHEADGWDRVKAVDFTRLQRWNDGL